MAESGVAKTPWLDLLEPLREHLTGSDHRGQRGSLRWLGAALSERGGRANTVRNILYKDLGSAAEKARLFELLSELYEEVGLAPPDLPEDLTAARAKRALGRDKRVIFARFMRELAEGLPQFIVVGGPSTGKGVLLEQVRKAYPESVFVNLAQDIVPALVLLMAEVAQAARLESLVAQLSPAQPFAVQAARQREVRKLVKDGLNALGKPLLLRAETSATLSTLPLRGEDGAEVSLAAWLEPLLTSLEIPYLAACSAAPPTLPYQTLRPPSREEARRYVQERLPDIAPETLEELLNQAGRNYGELSRLSLLELSRAGGDDAALLRDPRLGPTLRVLAALSPTVDPTIPVPLLEAALERPLSALKQAEHALLETAGEGLVRPALRGLLPEDEGQTEVHRLALEYYLNAQPGNGQPSHGRGGSTFRTLYHAERAGAAQVLVDRLRDDPSHLALLPDLWANAATGPQDVWTPELREQLALVVVRYRAVLGDYLHPEARAALALLATSRTTKISAWARVKMAEAQIDAGNFGEAVALMDDLPPLGDEAQAEAHLVHAALSRWRGAYDRAERSVHAALELEVPPLLKDRVQLWHGLVAKDAGRFEEALASLGQVTHNPLLTGRARYQEGELLTRLGQPEAGARHIETALTLLQSAPIEERARVGARLGTALRKLGRDEAASEQFALALSRAPDAFSRARIASEWAMLEVARARSWDALRLASEAEATFRAASHRPEEAHYRHQRTRHRLALAYWTMQTGEPYRAPFRGGRAALEVQAQLQPLFEEVAPLAPRSDRYAALTLDIATTLSLSLPPQEALPLLSSLELPSHYLQLKLRLSAAEAHLRAGNAPAAAASLAAVREVPPDPGLTAWKGLLDAELLLALDQREAACQVVNDLLTLAAPFRAQLGRVWGRVLCERDQGSLAARWLRGLDGPLALPDALALHFFGLESDSDSANLKAETAARP